MINTNPIDKTKQTGFHTYCVCSWMRIHSSVGGQCPLVNNHIGPHSPVQQQTRNLKFQEFDIGVHAAMASN